MSANIDDIFPTSGTVGSVPCGPEGCVSTAINSIVINGVNQQAANAAIDFLRTDVDTALADVQTTTIATVTQSAIIIGVSIFVPVLIIIIIIVWVLYGIGVISATTAIILTIMVIVISVVFLFLLYSSISTYLEQQLTVITGAVSNYVLSQDFLAALNQAACVYNSIAIPPETTTLRVNTNTNTSCAGCDRKSDTVAETNNTYTGIFY